MTIERLDTGGRMGQAVIPGHTVYLAGQVGEPGASVGEQTRQALARCGSSRERLLQVTTWVRDMTTDFAEMNAAREEGLPASTAAARAAAEGAVALPEPRVEVIAVAARG